MVSGHSGTKQNICGSPELLYEPIKIIKILIQGRLPRMLIVVNSNNIKTLEFQYLFHNTSKTFR